MHNKIQQTAKLNNRGAALVTVLVITTFIIFLATTMLYVASMNYQQKQTDYQNKQSFYGAEQSIDTLRSLLVEDVQKAYIAAYVDTASQFELLGKESSDARKAYYEERFNDELLSIWSEELTNHSGDCKAAVQDFMDKKGVKEEVYSCIYDVSGAGVYETNGTKDDGTKTTYQRFVIRGVRARYTYGNYTTFLYTDICINAPEIDWSVSTGTEGTDRDTIAFADCISYTNWQRIDYGYDKKDNEYDDVNVGTEIETAAATATETSSGE